MKKIDPSAQRMGIGGIVLYCIVLLGKIDPSAQRMGIGGIVLYCIVLLGKIRIEKSLVLLY